MKVVLTKRHDSKYCGIRKDGEMGLGEQLWGNVLFVFVGCLLYPPQKKEERIGRVIHHPLIEKEKKGLVRRGIYKELSKSVEVISKGSFSRTFLRSAHTHRFSCGLCEV